MKEIYRNLFLQWAVKDGDQNTVFINWTLLKNVLLLNKKLEIKFT